MDCHSQQTTNAWLHPPAAQAPPRVWFHRHRQTLPGEVWSDGSGEAPCCHCTLRRGGQAEEHVSEWQRQLHLPLNTGLEEVPVWHRAGFGQGRFFRGSQAEHGCLWYLTGLRTGQRRGGRKERKGEEERRGEGKKGEKLRRIKNGGEESKKE